MNVYRGVAASNASEIVKIDITQQGTDVRVIDQISQGHAGEVVLG